jgi:uncharacterized protein (DUF427 family)
MTQAIWNDTVLAETGDCVIVDGHCYFPPKSVRRDFLRPARMRTSCPRKGVAGYYDVVVNGKVNCKAAWSYPNPKAAAHAIKDYVAFWHGVSIVP